VKEQKGVSEKRAERKERKERRIRRSKGGGKNEREQGGEIISLRVCKDKGEKWIRIKSRRQVIEEGIYKEEYKGEEQEKGEIIVEESRIRECLQGGVRIRARVRNRRARNLKQAKQDLKNFSKVIT